MVKKDPPQGVRSLHRYTRIFCFQDTDLFGDTIAAVIKIHGHDRNHGVKWSHDSFLKKKELELVLKPVE